MPKPHQRHHASHAEPVASIGADELFDLVGNAFRRGSRWLRTTGIPIPRPAHLLPIFHFVHMKYVIGEPIPPSAKAEESGNDVLVKRLRREVEGELHELFECELASRVGIEIS